MKKLLLLSAILLCLTATAQTSIKFTTSSLVEARQLADSVALNAKHNFKFISAEEVSNYYAIKYKNMSDSTEEMPMIVAFNIERSGQNADLEIKGTTQYSFYKIYTRKFLDLFPFWQKFVNPKADANKITEFGGSDEATINDAKYAIKNNGGIWQIIYEYKINR